MANLGLFCTRRVLQKANCKEIFVILEKDKLILIRIAKHFFTYFFKTADKLRKLSTVQNQKTKYVRYHISRNKVGSSQTSSHYIQNSFLLIYFKSYLCYKAITSQNVPCETQVKSFFVS